MPLYNSYVLLIMGNDSINVGLGNIWHSWFAFRKGKRCTKELHEFQYHLERNIFALFKDLNNGTYRHGGYKKFVVCDNKRREISVASIRDRVVHRLVYDYLNGIYDKTFIYDAWSCRVKKGLLSAIERAQKFLRRFPVAHVWKCDIRKFFDSVDQKTLLDIISLKIKDVRSYNLLQEIIDSFSSNVVDRAGGGVVGMPIGNLTSQIFANIYLNEFDRFVKHILKSQAYVRYGDDFIMIERNFQKLNYFKTRAADFLRKILKLNLNPKNDKIFKAQHGLKFLGVILWPYGRKLNKRNVKRVREKLELNNVGSYYGIMKHHAGYKKTREFHWHISILLAFPTPFCVTKTRFLCYNYML